MPTGELERAARILAGAQFIDIYGVENSLRPGQRPADQAHLSGPALPVSHRCLSPADWGGPSAAGAAAIAFSHSGKSMDTVKALRLAQKAGAVTIAVAGGGPRPLPLRRRGPGRGGTAQTVYGKAIFSRVADLAVVDMLYMAVILSDYERFSHNLDHSGQVIADRDYPDQ